MKILPVIVLYNALLGEQKSYLSLLRDCRWREFVVYDNSPESFVQKISDERAVYVRDSSNGGLSKAYNKAAEIAREKGYEWLLLLDQDTTFPDGATDEYLRLADEVSAQTIIAPGLVSSDGKHLSPCRRGFFGKSVAGNLKSGFYPLGKAMPVNSGTCLRISEIYRCGGYDARLHLDFVDFDFIGRFAKTFASAKLQLMDSVAIQDFANDTADAEKMLIRYKSFLNDARRNPESLTVVLRHTLSLTLRTKKLCFIIEFFKIYF
ncbi:MAG: glycosyltransferase [Bacteroidaceae bacterium]|nr:glycosyltransferase [Bacteroidaceae bacterium]